MTVNAYDLAAGRPWLIEPAALEQVLAVADRMGNPEALQAKLGRPLDNTRTVTMRDGVAVIPITGPIFRHANLFTAISGATSTDVLATDIRAALDNPGVRGIALDINSPGGEAAGINELAAMVRDARSTKPITAYVGSSGASAAYWIASAANEIVVDPTAVVGSIGVVMSMTDSRGRDEKNGVRTHEIVSSQSPNKRADPATEGGRAEIQRVVDALAQVFVQSVAENRGVSTDTVTNDFGRGGVLVGQAAVTAGMADRLGSLESVIAELANPKAKTTGGKFMSNAPKGAITVSTNEAMRAAITAGHTADEITFQAPAEPSAEALAAARTEGTNAERARVTALLKLGTGKAVIAAINDGGDAATVSQAMVADALSRGVDLGSIARDATQTAHAAKSKEDEKSEVALGWQAAAAKVAGKASK